LLQQTSRAPMGSMLASGWRWRSAGPELETPAVARRGSGEGGR
jgi:hypothetical protein